MKMLKPKEKKKKENKIRKFSESEHLEGEKKETNSLSQDGRNFGLLYNFENDRFLVNPRARRPLKIKKLKRALRTLKNINKNYQHLYASYDYIQLKLASGERIQSWAIKTLPSGITVGDVDSSETLDFSNFIPIRSGLFSELTFGPVKSYYCEMECRQYRGFSFQGACDVCGVELTDSRVRRYRLAYIELALPIIHFWYFTTSPNYLKLFLSSLNKILPITMDEIRKHIYYEFFDPKLVDVRPILEFYNFHSFLPVLAADSWQEAYYKNSSLMAKYGLRKKVYQSELLEKEYFEKSFYSPSGLYNLLNPNSGFRETVGLFRYGGSLLKAALEDINLTERIHELRKTLETKDYRFFLSSEKYTQELVILESFLATKTHPSFLAFTHLPVLPPGLRPILPLPEDLVVSSDQNEMYRNIINRNNTLHNMFFIDPALGYSGNSLLQESIDVLFDNARLPKPSLDEHNKPFKSLTQILEGKEGRFRHNLIGKRVDYSGRSVIIPGPYLSLNECGIPFEMVTKLFGYLLISEIIMILVNRGSSRISRAKKLIDLDPPVIWWILVKILKYYSVFLNRAPTLHKFGVQAFDPILVLDKAIQLQPLVCSAFNADFDGDQMALHLPLLPVSQLEIKTMMRPSHNLFSPATGELLVKPTQDMIIGNYYLSFLLGENESLHYTDISSRLYASEEEVLTALQKKAISLHTKIFLRFSMEKVDIQVQNNSTLCFSTTSSSFSEYPILFMEEYKNVGKLQKIFFFTSIGIFIGQYFSTETLCITHGLIETTPGRVIVAENFKKAEKYFSFLLESSGKINLVEQDEPEYLENFEIIYNAHL